MLDLLSAADQAATNITVVAVVGDEPAARAAAMMLQPDWVAIAGVSDRGILMRPPPDPFEIRGFCSCAIDNSCQRRPRARAPRRNRGSRSAGSRNDDGGGGDGGDGPPGPPITHARLIWAPSTSGRAP